MSQKSNESRDLLVFLSITLLIVLVFLFALFGITGARVALGVVFMSLPIYLMCSNFGLEEGEKFIFSILLGLTIFPSLVYLLGFLMSFRASVIVVFVALITMAFILRRYKSKNFAS